jgi:4-hydroxythreonine-4-phosphate dehydrogenase
VIGHPRILRRAVELWQTGLEVVEIGDPSEAMPTPDSIPCIPCGSDDVLGVSPGTLDARAGQAAYDAVLASIQMALAKKIDAIVTAPLQKEALHRAGHNYPGHTELLAQMCGVDDYAMMLYLGPSTEVLSPAGLAVVHVTLHTALRNVFGQLTQDAVLAKARLAHQFMSRLMRPVGDSRVSDVVAHRHRAHPSLREVKPRIGICSLNPHGGEGGLFGDEEIAIIRPAVERGLAEGLQLEGPLPTDTLMVSAREGKYDALVAMYHDQGHIALKLLGMHQAVNVTLGLPIIRTSVAHGTAFDIAWRRQAETGSMIEAIRVASRLAAYRNDERRSS